ncbi:hypothetical protein J8J14_14015 [Roseomonas sp. SSH11]|uniref:Heme peroxidase n=1 Tax=Pararoseomonas baculiformis TaxID=2820812 RepID=A0ABS4AFT5_9PROT|nr:peroxidase family protein [Pararoseomonas baculiformis]MBP0445888.1 hypothetical protein [Pararoseomonas baculiformis]
MVNLVRHDLEFILKQIKIAEAHSAGIPLRDIRLDASGNVITDPNAPADPNGAPAVPTTLSPYGLRTVDGSYNNLVEGREEWGAADQPFPRITTPVYRNESDDSIVFGAGTPGEVVFTDGNYGEFGAPPPASMGLGGGTVVDADPRTISNLIVDQTLENPAAIYTALAHAGVTGQAITTALNEIRGAYASVKAATIAEGAASADDKPAATAAREAAQEALDVLLGQHGIEMDGKSVVIPNVAPDEGLSAPYNSWFTLFGQFFDHGLDLVTKGGNGTIYIPLQPDDPLYNPATPHSNFMVLSRAPSDAANLTTPWVDQNQTYTSHSSHQLFLREYKFSVDSDGDGVADSHPLSTGRLLEGDRGLATWADVKEQARTLLGINLTDADVTNIPLFVMDEYGEFIRGPNGLPQLVTGLGADGKPGGGDDTFMEGNLSNPISTAGAVRTGHAFLDDIAHAAVPVISGGVLQQDSDDDVGYFNADGTPGGVNSRGSQTAYDNEMLDAHYITGDGRGNENIGLSAVHHVFHSEHNHLVDQVKQRAIESGDIAFLNEWLLQDLPGNFTLPTLTTPAEIKAFADTLSWDGERLFQAARFTTEMQYQHLVFEEFARKVQPDVDAFVFNASVDINPAIFAEFAHVVYRFGHSMLKQEVAATNGDGTDASMDLFDAFLNPLAFGSATVSHEQAAGAIVRGMTSQVGNEIDEFVTDVLRNQLVGIPLDLAALNIARGRDTGIPSLNAARAQFKEAANGDTQLDPYKNWTDFALNLKNPASIVNFIAAYGTHNTVTSVDTIAEKRDAAMKLVFGDASLNEADRKAFLGGTGIYANKLGGLDDVDLWVGGMAEKKMAFGGMLGSTFSFVFELQMENLQNADRFYYLSRVQGLNFLNELENNSFAKMVLNNTDLGASGYALPGDIFSVPDHVLYMDKNVQTMFGYVDPEQEDPVLQVISPMVERIDENNDGVAEYIRVNTNDHVLIQGTEEDDTIIAGGGDDSVWGRGGNDRIEAGYGVDKIHGGAGDDIITNSGTDIGEVDMLHGEEGNDVIHGGSGLALVFGNEGSDYIIAGPDGKEVFGGTGNDFILGGEGDDFLLGNEGDDWIEAGNGFDTTAGDNSELNFNSSIIGHDVMFAGQNEHDFDAESGDDIMVQGESVMRNEGMYGYDWAIHKGNQEAADSDLTRPIFTTDEEDILRDRFDQVEALSGWEKNDVLRGDNRGDLNAEAPAGGGDDGATFARNELSQAGVDRIAGLRQLLGDRVEAAPTTGDLEQVVAFDSGNILLGGGGSDIIQGRGGDDYIDGDNWLNVRIGIYNSNGVEIGSADSMTGKVTKAGQDLYGGASLNSLMLNGTLNPSQLRIVREILNGNMLGDIDTAVYSGDVADYTFTRNHDRSIRVVGSDTNAAGDMIRNIERIRFVDPLSGATTAEFDIQQLVNENQLLTGGPGNDTFDGWLGNDTLIGGGGTDTAVFSGPVGNYSFAFNGLGIIVSDQVGTDGVDNLFSIEQMRFGDQTLIIRAGSSAGGTTVGVNNQANLLLGFQGNDRLDARAGNDVLVGGLGRDTLIGGVGADTFLFSSAAEAGNGTGVTTGRDIIMDFNRGQGDRIDLSGIDAVLGGAHDSFTFIGTNSFTAAGQLRYFQEGGATIIEGNLSGTSGAEFQIQLATPLTLLGTDFILGAVPPTVLGGNGNDMLQSGTGDRILVGGGGTDTAVFAGPVGNYSFALGGTSIIVSDLVGTDGVDMLESMEQMQFGGQTLIVRAGNDASGTTVGVNNQANLLLGYEGNDRLDARAGNDVLVGGLGSDTLIGGTGADTFLFSSAAEAGNGTGVNTGRDIIMDFNRGQGDKIDLSGIDAVLGGANDSFTFIGTNNFTAAGQLRYVQEGGATIIEGNLDGTDGAEFQIQLATPLTLLATDFIL